MFNWLDLIQILVVVLLVWIFYKTFIKNTQSEKLVRGLFGLALLWILSFVLVWLKLGLLGRFLHWLALFLSISLVVVFQPELRKFMALMGNVGQWRKMFAREGIGTRDASTLNAICSATEYMSEKHIGALIVFPYGIADGAITKPGVRIDAAVSTELILTIFFNKTPLHDGAMIIENGRIAYAGAVLPLSQNNLNWKYGTRHRAALGLSEQSGATILVVSEESGDISIAERGKFTKYDDIKKLRAKLERILDK